MQIITKDYEFLPSAQYRVIDTFEANGHTFYVTDQELSDGKPLIIADIMVKEVIQDEGEL